MLSSGVRYLLLRPLFVMFASADFNQFATGDIALSNAHLFGALRRLPPGVVRGTILGATWLETWLRWPLATLKVGDRIDETLAAIDPAGERFGLTSQIKRRIKRHVLYNQLPNAIALLSALDSDGRRRRTLAIRDTERLLHQCDAGPGAIVAGFRTGPYPAFPWAVAAASGDRPVMMIVSYERLARLGENLGKAFIPRLNERVTFVASQDPSVLARSLSVLKMGGIVATLLEGSPVQFARKTAVDFLDWRPEVPYGLSYLSAVTSRPVIPASMTRRRGTRFTLKFHEPVAAPARNQLAMQSQAQQLYTELERHVRKVPDQWVGWLLLGSNMGIHLSSNGDEPLPASL